MYTIASGPFAGRQANVQALNLSPGAAVTADSYSAAFELGDRAVARLTLDVTALTGGDALDVVVECSHDGTTWYTSGSFTQATGVTAETKCFLLDRHVRAYYNVTDAGGGVSATFTLTGETV